MTERTTTGLIAALALCAPALMLQTAVARTVVKAAVPAVTQRFDIGGEGGWDYLTFDPAGKRLFISRGTHVVVMDAATGRVVGDIPGTDGVHGIALVPGMNKGFTSNGRANSVTAFNLATLDVLGKIPVSGQKPDAIIYDPASAHILTFNGNSDNVTAINPASLVVVATIRLPGRPEFAAADGHGRVYVNLEDKGEIAVINSIAGKVVAVWWLGLCSEPSALALDAVHHRVFSTCHNNKLVVLDTRTGKLVAQLPIGAGPDAAAYDPLTRRIFSSNGDGTLTVIKEKSPNRYAVIANVRTELGARTMALDSLGRRIFLATATLGALPAPTAAQPRPRPSILPGTFRILVVR